MTYDTRQTPLRILGASPGLSGNLRKNRPKSGRPLLFDRWGQANSQNTKPQKTKNPMIWYNPAITN
jgi:hypothetical protein